MEAGLVGLGVGIVGTVAGWLLDRRRRSYTDQATTPAAAVFAGRNEVKGRASTSKPLVSHLTKTKCVWWEYTLEEERIHTRTVTTTDSKGHTQTRTETYTQWHEIDRKRGRFRPFDVVDDTGSVTVRLGEAKVVPRELRRDVFREDQGGGLLERLIGSLGDNRTGRYRQTERAVALGDPLFVVGEATMDQATGVPVISQDVLVSTRSEESHTGRLGLAVVALTLVAMGGITVGTAGLLEPDDPAQPTAWLPGLGISLLGLAIAGWVILYNRLQLLIESVERAWTLIDIQLQRRHDLVPALIEAVKGHAAHEASLLENVAAGRWKAGQAQQPTQLAEEAARQTHSLRQVLAVAERYPELTADDSFLNLQEQLADTENRIAGARTFYNDTVTLLHNRARSFPGVLVARLVKRRSRGLIPAEGFERTVPEVDVTTEAPTAPA